jgi:hypothetical protein
MKKKVIGEGYTITVESWENDGDNYNTLSITVDTAEKAKAYYDLMQLCRSQHNQSKGAIYFGNNQDFSTAQYSKLKEFFKDNTILLNELVQLRDLEDNDVVEDIFHEVTSPLLGSSEYYNCRVMASCDIVYSPEDIYLEEIIF